MARSRDGETSAASHGRPRVAVDRAVIDTAAADDRPRGGLDHVDLIVLIHRCPPALVARSCAALSVAMGEGWRGRLILVENAAAAATSAAARSAALEHFCSADRLLLRSTRNLGFGGGVDVGVAASENRYVGVFNPDGLARPTTVAALASALDREPAALVSGAAVLSFAQEPIAALDERATETDWVPGVAAVYRRTAFVELGGFDPLYFMYCEDVELSRRARRAGWRLLNVPGAPFHHGHDWDRWQRFHRTRLWTIANTTLAYQCAPSRSAGLAHLATERVAWLAKLARQRRFARLAGAVVGTVSWPTRILGVERRRRVPWSEAALREWFDRTLPTIERSPVVPR